MHVENKTVSMIAGSLRGAYALLVEDLPGSTGGDGGSAYGPIRDYALCLCDKCSTILIGEA